MTDKELIDYIEKYQARINEIINSMKEDHSALADYVEEMFININQQFKELKS